MNKEERYGAVLNSLQKSIKSNKIKCRNLVFTIYDHKVEVNKKDLRLYVRRRDFKLDNYGPCQELLFECSDKNPTKYTTKDLESRIFELEGLSQAERENLEIALIKYHPNRYKWLIMSEYSEGKIFL
jgi:hypothetical protein